MRILRLRLLFKALKKYCRGEVLDVGGGDFYLTIQNRLNFKHWTNLETTKKDLFDAKYTCVVGNGENIPFDKTFDTVVNIQVLEHTFNPMKMVEEMSRVLKGYGIFLIPQTSVMHCPPHYYNFTKTWIKEAMKKADLEIVELKPVGGVWTTMASHLVHFFFQSCRLKGFSTKEDKRSIFFYLLFPLMVIFSLVSIPICMLLSLGDLTEEPNNWLVIVKHGKNNRNN